MMFKFQISNFKFQINKFKKLLNYWIIGLLDNSCQRQAGQIVLMLVLITIVGLTIGLSLISRTVTDIRLSSQIEQSSRAFSAAEAGVENALKYSVVGGPTQAVSLPGASGTYSVSQIGGTSTVLTFPLTSPTDSQTVWLADHTDGTLNETANNYPSNSNLDICWATDPNINPAIVISLFYKSGTDYKVKRGAYDYYAGTNNNGFDNIVENAGKYCGSNFRFRKSIKPTDTFGIALTDKLLFLRIRPAYENTIIAVDPVDDLPVQGKVITSVGQTETGVVRKIQVTSGNNELPAIFDFGLFFEE